MKTYSHDFEVADMGLLEWGRNEIRIAETEMPGLTPIERMNKGLGDWLSFRVPFAVKGDLKDEVLELKEKIESLINISKQTKS